MVGDGDSDTCRNETVSPGVTLSDVKNKIQFTTTSIGYIDDNNIITTSMQPKSEELITHELQKTLDGWSGLLHATGGTLSLEKCTASHWTWQWKQGLPIILDVPTHVRCQQTQTPIPHATCQTAIKYLGI